MVLVKRVLSRCGFAGDGVAGVFVSTTLRAVAKVEAIANADGYLSNVDLPPYGELLNALTNLLEMADLLSTEVGWRLAQYEARQLIVKAQQ